MTYRPLGRSGLKVSTLCVGTMMFANRTFDRAVELAREFRGSPVPFEDLARYLRLADVVVLVGRS